MSEFFRNFAAENGAHFVGVQKWIMYSGPNFLTIVVPIFGHLSRFVYENEVLASKKCRYALVVGSINSPNRKGQPFGSKN